MLRLLLKFWQLYGVDARSLPTCVSTSQKHDDPQTNRHCRPLFLLGQAYGKCLMSTLGEMVFRMLSGLVKDWRPRTPGLS
jgi:hypothetical protein